MCDSLLYVLLSALMVVESGGDPEAYNAEEEARGLLQIRPIWIQDLNRISHKAYTTEMLKDEAELRLAAVEWLRYYGKQITRIEGRDPTFEDYARMWCSGPTGYSKDCSLPYWDKIKVVLEPLLQEYCSVEAI